MFLLFLDKVLKSNRAAGAETEGAWPG
ncbi:hypothetical protein ROS217_04365 [Roseovarius sp. 217]|nr:hypothetical protein ROS217_04365 [Roseovarius sp. 217]